MFERTDKINEYQWTGRRFEIVANISDISDFRDIVLEFILPIVQSIRHSEKRFAERWYWSWWKKPQTNWFCRLYFLAKKEDHAKIWEKVEDVRKSKFNNSIKPGTSENVWRELSDVVLEWGITLEHASEMSLMIWKGSFPGSNNRYGKTFHHLFEPLLISDKNALKILLNFIESRVLYNDFVSLR